MQLMQKKLWHANACKCGKAVIDTEEVLACRCVETVTDAEEILAYECREAVVKVRKCC